MSGWAVIAARFAVYLTLAVAFGVPLQASIDRWQIRRRWLIAIVGSALLASTVALLVLVASMAGTAILPVDWKMLLIVLGETPVGAAFVVRFAALAVAVVACGWTGRGGTMIVCAGSGVALATVAWTGHGAMQDGTAGTVHLAADIVHLIAGTAWIGAIITLSLRLLAARRDPAALRDTLAALHRFALTGSALVAAIVVTGVVNGWMIVGAEGSSILRSTRYGWLLVAKVALFAVMLAFGARHRWVSVPRFRDALNRGDDDAPRALLRSLTLELCVGLAILFLVAWLGTLSPSD